MAGFTGFLIGAPFALVVLATFTVEREERAALEKVHRLTVLAWGQYRDAVCEYCGENQIAALENSSAQVLAVHDETFDAIRQYRSKEVRTATDHEDLKTFVSSQLDRWADALTDLSQKVGLESVLKLRWYAIRTDWDTLNQYVRLQRLDVRLPWFKEREVDSYLRFRMSSEIEPTADFMRIHQGEHRIDIDSSTMNSAIDDMQRYLELEYEAFDGLIVNHHEHRFPHEIVLNYREARDKLVLSLRGLREAVEKIDSAGWPENAREPE